MTSVQERPPTHREAEPSTFLGRAASLRLPGRRRTHGSAKVASRRLRVGHLIAIWSMLTCTVATAWFVFFALVLSSLQFQHSQHDLYATFREQLSQQVAPLGGEIAPDSPVALLSIPDLHVKDSVIVEGTAAGDLAKGAGHRRDTPLPGQPGTSLIFGRETLFSGIFGHLASARPGELFSVTTGQGIFSYKVEQLRHAGDRFPTLLAAGESRITFVTAEGADLANGWTPQRTVYLDAKLQGKSAPAPPGRLSSVPDAEQAMNGDVSALFPLVLWIPLLVLAALAVVWAQDRWGRWQTWLVGVPIVLAALWGITETGIQLLPNLM